MDIETLNKIAEQVNLEYEIGIWSEVNSFLESYKDIIELYNISYDDNERRYNIIITLNDFNRIEVGKLFSSFVRFIEYSNATFYVRKEYDSEIVYVLLSAMDSKKGFLCHIKFQ